MANRYWIGGSGNWTDTAHWSTASNGSGGATVPGSADVAIFDASSGAAPTTVTVNATTTVSGVTFTGVDVMYTFASAGNLTVTGTLVVATNTTYTNGLTIDGNATVGALTLTSGTLALGTSNITVNGIVTVSGSTTRTLAFGTGSITVNRNVTAAVTIWSGATLTGMVVTGTPTVNFAFTGSNFGVSINHGSTTGGASNNAISISSLTSTISAHNITAAGHFTDFNFGSFSGVLVNSARSIYGSITLGSGMTTSAGANLTTLATVGTTKTITTNGVLLNFAVTLNSSGGKITLADALTMASARTFTLTSGTIALGGFTLTCGIFSSTGSGTRSIDSSSVPSYIVLNSGTLTTNTTVWSCSTTTSMSIVNGAPEISVIADAATGIVATLNHGGATDGGSRIIVTGFTTSSSQLIVTTTGHFSYLNLADSAGALRFTSGATSVYGVLIVGSSTIVNSSASAITLRGATITSNGVVLNFPMGVSTPGATLNDALTLGSTRTLTFNSGNLNLNGYTLTVGLFSSNNSTARSIDFAAGSIIVSTTITGITNVWSCATITNFSYTGAWSVSYNITGNFGTYIYHGPTGGSESTAYGALINPIVEGPLSVVGYYLDVDLSGISNTITAPAFTAYRDVKFSGTSTLTETINELTFAGTTYDNTLTMNGNTLASNIRLNATTTLYLSDALTMNKGITITAGTFDANDFNVTTRSVVLFGVGAKTINMKSGLWTINGSTGGVVGDSYTWRAWDLSTNAANPSFTLDKGTANILLSAFADSHILDFYGGGLTYNKVSVSGNYSGTQVRFYNSNTFDTLESLKTVAATIRFNDGTTQTIGTWNINGSSGNAITLTSVSTGTHTLSKSSGSVSTSYLAISKSIATGGATWNAYTTNGNTDGGGNSGWNFFAAVVSAFYNFFMFFQ